MARYRAGGLVLGGNLTVMKNMIVMLDITGEGDLTIDNVVGLAPPATRAVAADDTSSWNKEMADFVCDGTDDDVTINAALDALPDDGGRVILLEGTFVCTGSLVIPSNTTLQGMGPATVIAIADDMDANLHLITNSDPTGGNEGIVIRNLKLDGNKANNSAGIQRGIFFDNISYSTIENVIVTSFRNDGFILYDCDYNLVSNCLITLNDGTSGFSLDGAAMPIRSRYNRIIRNTILSNKFFGLIVNGDGNNENLIAENMVRSNGRDGIHIDGGKNNTVIGNHVSDNSTDAANTWSGIMVTNDADNTNLQCNTVRGVGHKYGIRINQPTCDKTFVTNNDLLNSATTAAYSNAGTGTNTTPGNRVA